MIRLIRLFLGKLIIFFDCLIPPKIQKHTPEEQKQLDMKTSAMSLYQFAGCPFCVKTRRAARRLGLKLETRDAQNNPEYKEQLVREGGQYQVPCLRVTREDGSYQWIYESSDIISFLEKLI